MKKMLTLVLVSVLGGAITLGTYKTFLEKEEQPIATTLQDNPVFLPTNYNSNKTVLAAAEGIDFTTAADKTLDAVVHVKNVAVNNVQPTLQDLFYGRVPQRRQLGTGSGVIISPDGYIITNNHVIEDSEQLSITLNDNRTLVAEIVGTDPKTDIALLKVETEDQLPYTTFGDSDSAKIGEWVLAVGNPFNLTSTVTAGIISAKSRDLSGQSTQSFIQTDAAVNPGNSGGALVNTAGELIGINTAITSQTGSYIGYSFAVPSNIAKKVVQDIMEFGNVQNGILGVIGGSLNSNYAEKLGVAETEGFYVDDVEEDTGAAEAGIKSGDIIKKIDNISIKKFSDLRGFLDSKRPNDVVNVTLLRNGVEKELSVTLLKSNTYILPVIGVIKNAKPEELRKYKTKHGVKIMKVNGTYGRYLQSEGIEEGNIITAINNIKIESIDDVDRILKNRDTYQPLSIELINSKGETNRYGLR
ncbi:trypsin-like peptidase domain-containing protein [Olleya sp. YS]|uniref:S1C family serine protease n=1 Tax=Olleya sp. YS TaxID=3028318 RepID=UPI0024343F88|nr:trypsin-like peptidase domain-containing protein [Olleya sp. YS]WGD34821.1 trypsin-like peptidase domain-containing protein [Olleya sp. YS]